MATTTRTIHKNIYKHRNTFILRKTHKHQKITKTFKDLKTAKKYLDQLKANNYQPLPETPEETSKRKLKEYYKHITLRYTHTQAKYAVFNKNGQYLKQLDTIEEALWFRELYQKYTRQNLPEPIPDLTQDNPYIIDGLQYPIPDRLKPKPIKNTTGYGKGQIITKGPQSYQVKYGEEHYMNCRTYEYAYYIRKRLQECDWDKKQLKQIKKEYPEWYTWLLHFYKYISPDKNKKGGGWIFTLPPSKNNGKLDHIRATRLEDILWERDLYLEYGFDEELVVYCADDRINPYYDMELPPFPQRRVRKVVGDRNTHKKELDDMREYLLDGGETLGGFCELSGNNPTSIRNWLRNYGTNWRDFKELCLSGEDIWEVLEFKPLIIQPDLSRHYNNNGYVHVMKRNDGPRFKVQRDRTYYCTYPTRELAEKCVKLLRKYDWDKSKMPLINEQLGFVSMVNSKRWIYELDNGSYVIRHKDKDRHMVNFGTYWDYDKAVFVRDQLIECGWSKDEYLEVIRPLADRLYPDQRGLLDKYVYRIKRKYDFYYTVQHEKKHYGKFKDKCLARIVRDLLYYSGWDTGRFDEFLVSAEWIYYCQRLYDGSFVKMEEFLWI